MLHLLSKGIWSHCDGEGIVSHARLGLPALAGQRTRVMEGCREALGLAAAAHRRPGPGEVTAIWPATMPRRQRDDQRLPGTPERPEELSADRPQCRRPLAALERDRHRRATAQGLDDRGGQRRGAAPGRGHRGPPRRAARVRDRPTGVLEGVTCIRLDANATSALRTRSWRSRISRALPPSPSARRRDKSGPRRWPGCCVRAAQDRATRSLITCEALDDAITALPPRQGRRAGSGHRRWGRGEPRSRGCPGQARRPARAPSWATGCGWDPGEDAERT